MAFLLTDAYSRNFTGALDASCVHQSLSALKTYMYSDATCYAGQVVAVVADSSAENNGLYLIVNNASYNSSKAKSATNSPFIAQMYPTITTMESSLESMTGLMQFIGVLPEKDYFNALMAKKGYAWLVSHDSTGSTYGIFDTAFGLEAGDVVICIDGDEEFAVSTINTADQAARNFVVINKNIRRSVSSSAESSTNGELVAFDGTGGKTIKGAGQTLSALKSECKNLANATGTLGYAHGGTGATTLDGAKSNLGITALETTLAGLTSGSGAAAKADKLTTARTLKYMHAIHGDLNEMASNSFDGSADMAALTIDGVFMGTDDADIPEVISTNFPTYAHVGTEIFFSGTGSSLIEGYNMGSGVDARGIAPRLARFRRAYVKGTYVCDLLQISSNNFFGSFFYDGRIYYLMIFNALDGTSQSTYMYMMPKDHASYSDEVFKAVIEKLEDKVANLSNIMPIGTTFSNANTGTTYTYQSYGNSTNNFSAKAWQ